MKAKQIRRGFLDFFESKGHRVVPSSSLVPIRDPTLLFVNAGMNQFKDVFLGLETRSYRRATTVQRCVRAGGKHNDLEKVGVTARHHTFFEMLGNFSFGDYFKRDAIAFAWELLVDRFELTPSRLAVTVFEGDSEVPRDAEAYELWTEIVATERIYELGRADNFWSMGDTGPCGPCSEIHYFQGEHLPCPEKQCKGVACECDRWLEIWNLVFMQFNRDENGALRPLPAPSVDTGMGLERVTAVVQGVESNYDTDIFAPILRAIEERAGRRYRRSSTIEDVAFRVIADHARSATFLIADGVMPSNDGRGYVLRKILRRAMRHGTKLGLDEPFLFELTTRVIEEMREAYPDLLLSRELVERVVRSEEERFRTTLSTGISVLEEKLRLPEVTEKRILPGSHAFELYDTFGVPFDFLTDIASEHRIEVDQAGFDEAMEAQRRRARESWKKGSPASERTHYGEIRARGESRFQGYSATKIPESRVVALAKDGLEVRELVEGDVGEVFLDVTPFYPEGGGQVGDQGVLAGPNGAADVLDTQSPVSGLISHRVRISKGSIAVDQRVVATVNETVREGAKRHHTITHMLHAALRETLGPHVKQKGSLVAPDRLRFDFSHFAPLSLSEIQQIEGRVNEKIQQDLAVESSVLPIDDALARGAIAFFGEKYGDRVRVIEISDFSIELCGGTHLSRTGEAGFFVITSESSISSGIRRIEALTGRAALEFARSNRALVTELSRSLRARPDEILVTVDKLKDELKRKEREVEELKRRLVLGTPARGEESTITIGDVLVWTPAAVQNVDKKQHRQLVDAFKEKNRDRPWVVISAAVNEQKVSLIVEVSEGLAPQIRADQLVKELTPIIEGKGGGKAERAEAGGRFPERIPELYERGRDVIRLALEGQRV